MNYLLLVVLTFFIESFSAAATRELPKFKPLEFNPPIPSRSVLSNGITIYTLQDDEIPLITLQLTFSMRSELEPATLTGLSYVMGTVWAEGGTRTKTPKQVQDILDAHGASLSIGVGGESTSASLVCRKNDFPMLLELLMEVLREPRFDAKRIDLEIDNLIDGIRRRNDDPEEVARREFRHLLYGYEHPYARVPVIQSAERIKRADFIRFHQQFLSTQKLYVGLSGDWQKSDLDLLQNKWLLQFPQQSVPETIFPQISEPNGRRIFFTQKNLTQSQIRIGHFGISRHHPDEYALEVLNSIWGGGGPSRLFREVRTEKGLAYSVWSAFTQPEDKGFFVMGAQTQGPQTIETINAMMKVLKSLHQGQITDTEIQSAKEAIINRFVANYQTSAQIVAAEMSADYNGYPKDYIRNYTKNMAKVTKSDVIRVAQNFLKPDDVTIYVLGDLSRFEKPLSTLGQPSEVKLYQAPPIQSLP